MVRQVWDRDIILSTLSDYYEKDVDLLLEAIQGNFTDVRIRPTSLLLPHLHL